jgi:hypothetical protein
MDKKCGCVMLKLFRRIIIFGVLMNLACVGLIHGTEPTIVQCRDTILWLDVVDGYISVTLKDGSVQIFDSVGREVSFFDIDLDVPEYEMVDDPKLGSKRRAKTEISDYTQLIPSRQALLVFRNTYDPNSGGTWGLIKNSFRNLIKGNPTIEMYDMNSKDQLFTGEFNGLGMKGAVNHQKTMIALMSFMIDGIYLQVMRNRDGEVILKEELDGTAFLVFDSTTLHVYASNLGYTFYKFGSDSVFSRESEDLEFEIHPFLVFRPLLDAGEKYIFYNKSFTGNVGVAKCFGNEALYERCLESILVLYEDDPMKMESVYFEILDDYRLLIYRPEQNSLVLADFVSGEWNQFKAADLFGADLPPYFAILTANKYVAYDIPHFVSEFSIVKFELPDNSGY